MFFLQLAKQGYAYYGSEPLYSGVSGTVMHADIYMGVVYYQRLRHMVRARAGHRCSFIPADALAPRIACHPDPAPFTHRPPRALLPPPR
jgi:hypothetical protein